MVKGNYLKDQNHVFEKGLFVVGPLAGWRNKTSFTCGSDALVATDIRTLWNDGKDTHMPVKI